MGFFNKKVDVEIVPISGVLRITVRTKPDIFAAVVDVVVMSACVWMVSRSFTSLPRIEQILIALAIGSGVAGIIEVLQHRESVIEFGSEKLMIRRSVMGLMRTSEYAVQKCSELTWREPNDEDRNALECKVGFRTVRFGSGLSEKQAQDILAALQKHFPDVAQKMGVSSGMWKSHVTQLGLS
jgi:hypothetical protein